MAKRGRPAMYREELAQISQKLALHGLTIEQIAEALDVTARSFYRWLKRYPELSQSIKEAKDVADREVEQSLFKKAKGFTRIIHRTAFDSKTGQLHEWDEEHYYPPDVTSCIFWLKNRQPQKWRDKHEVTANIEINAFLRKVIEKASEIGPMYLCETRTISGSSQSVPHSLP